MKTSTIGSFPKPVELRRARWKFAEEEIDALTLRAAEDRALVDVLELQKSLGLDLLVDGQMDRSDMISHFAERLDGFDAGGLVRCWGNRYYRRPRIVDAVSRPEPVALERWKAANAAAGDLTVKAVLTGPYTLMHWSFDEHYPSRRDTCMALAEVIGQEAEDLVAAGATELQIDDGAISARPEEMPLVRQALEHVASKVAGRARIWLHLAFGDLDPVLDDVLQLPVDGFLLELTNAGRGLAGRLGALPQDKLLGAGVIDTSSPRIESVDEVRARLESILDTVPAERLWVTPDAGLRGLTTEQARAKLETMTAAVAALS